MSEHVPVRRLRGAKSMGKAGGSTGTAASEEPNTLRSKAIVKLLEVLGEGEIKGLVNGAKSIFFNDTVLQNPDGSFNFTGITYTERYGLPDQDYIPDFDSAATTMQVGIKVTQAISVTRTLFDDSFDKGVVTARTPALLFQDAKTNTLKGAGVEFRIEVKYVNGPWTNPFGGNIALSGKTSAPYDRAYPFRLPRGPAGEGAPWDVRFTRDYPDQTTSQAQNDIYFGTLAGIVEAKFSYPYTAMIGLVIDAEQFGSDVPVRGYEVYGRIMQVPDNYNPETRTYTGIWQGLFKWAWSDNPAWVLYDVLTNNRFGLGDYIDASAVDKWSLYSIAGYCDQLVPDGYGGMEPRFTFNGVLKEAKQAYDVISLIAASFRGMAYWSSGAVTATQDRPKDPDIIVTRSNVVNGRITYQSTAKKARHTVAIVTWRDPQAGYRETPEVVEDADGIERFGIQEKPIDAPWCTSRGQAVRIGRWVLFTELHETQIATYRAGLDHSGVRPGMIAAIHDPSVAGLALDDSLGGRVRTGTTASRILLDRTVTLTAGVDYTLMAVLPSGKVEERQVRATSGDVDSVQLVSPLSEAPVASAQWIMAYADLRPQLFQVVTAREVEPHLYEIQGLQYEPSKHGVVDENAQFDPLPTYDQGRAGVAPPSNINAIENFFDRNGTMHSKILLSWSPPAQAFSSAGFYVSARLPDGSFENYGLVKSTSIEFVDTQEGDYVFYVATNGINGKTSQAIPYSFTALGWDGVEGPKVTGLQVVGGGNVFSGRSCSMEWAITWPEGLPRYAVATMIRVYDADLGTILYTERVVGQTWTYDYEVNRNHSGPRRRFQVRASAVDILGRESTAAVAVVSNPAPPVVALSLTSANGLIFASYVSPTDNDLEGGLFWASKTPGFDPLTTPPTTDSKNPTAIFPGDEGDVYYVRVACYDAFGKDPNQLNISAEQSVQVRVSLIDVVAPEIPGKATLTALPLTKSADGRVTAGVRATWVASPSTNFGSFDTRARLRRDVNVESDWTQYPAGDELAQTFENLPPATLFEFQLRASNRDGFKDSGWSETASIMTLANTAKPGNITGLTVETTFQTAFLRWVNPTDNDLALVEVYAAATNDQTAAVRVAVVPAPGTTWQDPTLTAAGGTRFYWVRAFNSSGIGSADVTGPAKAVSTAITFGQLSIDAITSTLTAQGLETIGAVTSLPAVANYKGPSTLSYLGKLWTIQGGEWKPSVTALGVDGKLTAEQIAGVNAAVIAGTLSADVVKNLSGITQSQLAQLDLAKMGGIITASQIGAGEITTSKLAVASANRIYNAELANGLSGWDAPAAPAGSTRQFRIRPLTETRYAPDGFYSVEFSLSGSPPSGAFWDVINQPMRPDKVLEDYQVAAGIKYEFSVALSVHRCYGQVYIQWLNSSLGHISYTGPDSSTTGSNYAEAGNVRQFPRCGVIGAAPTGAVYARLRIRMLSTGELNPYLFISAPMFAAITDKQTEFSPYVSPSITTIDGGKLLTDSVTARNIAAGSVSTSKLLIASTNLIYNANGKILKADGYQSGIVTDPGNSGAAMLQGTRTDNTYPGTIPFLLRPNTNNPAASSYGQICFRRPIEKTDSPYKAHYPVVAGQGYELSAYLATYDCAGQLYADSYDDAGTYKGRAYTSPDAKNQSPNGLPVRRGGFFTVPTGATNLAINVIGYWTGAGNLNPHLFVSAPMLAPCDGKQTELSPFVEDGLTVMDGASIVTGSLSADKITANSITAAQIAAGAIKAAQIDAGAITTEKLAVSSQAGNLIWNSDFLAGGGNVFYLGGAYGNATGAYVGINGAGPTWQPPGMGSGQASLTGSNITGYSDVPVLFPTINPDPTSKQPFTDFQACIPGQRYELSGYISSHRSRAYVLLLFYDANQGYITEFPGTPSPFDFEAAGVLSNWFRSTVFGTAPSNAAFVRVIVRTVYQNGGTSNNPYTFFTGLYLGKASKNQTEFSAWSPQSATVINGAGITTGSLHANRIVAGTIYTDLMTAGSINADRLDVITLSTQILNTKFVNASDGLLVGSKDGSTLSSILNGGSNTKINGGSISTNSIDVTRLRIGSRGISTVGIEFYIERKDGTLTNKVGWTGGYVLYTKEDGQQISTRIPAATKDIDGAGWYISWNQSEDAVQYNPAGYNEWVGNFKAIKDDWGAIKSDRNRVMMAAISAITGLAVFYGGTIIDGTKITTLSITANQIAANTITADKIQANTVFTQNIFVGGRTRTTDGAYTGVIQLDGAGNRMVVNDHNDTANRVIIGNISPWLGNTTGKNAAGQNVSVPRYGMVVYNEQNQLIFSNGGVPKEALTGFTGSGNILFNSTFEMNDNDLTSGNRVKTVPGWAAGGNNDVLEFGIRAYPDDYGFRDGVGTFMMSGNQSGTDRYGDLVARTSKKGRYPASAGQRWEASAYVNCHRSKIEIYIGFYNYLGQALAYQTSGQIGPLNIGANQYISQFRRIGVFATAPGGTEFVDMFIRNTGIDEVNPYQMMVMPYLGQATPNQTEFSPWTPGSGTLTITPDNVDTYIRGAVIGTALIKKAAIRGAQIDDAAITNAKIDNLEVDSAKIANLTIGNVKIADGAVTTYAGATSANNDAYCEVRTRSNNSKILINVWMRGNSVNHVLAGSQDTGILQVEANGDRYPARVIEKVGVPLTWVYLSGEGGNHIFTPSFGYSFVWDTLGAQNNGLRVKYTGSLPNQGVAIFAMELSK